MRTHAANVFTTESHVVAPAWAWLGQVETTMSSKMNVDAYVGWLGEVSYVAGKWEILRHLTT